MKSVVILIALSLTSCVSAFQASIGSTIDQSFNRIFLTDFETAWQSGLEALKNHHLDITNKEGGYLQTKWIDNTAEKNLLDNHGNLENYLKAQYRLKITFAKGFYEGKPSVKLAIQKDQLIQKDVLDGWKTAESDGIDEKTMLYRIGRLIHIKTKLNQLEEEKVKKELEDIQF